MEVKMSILKLFSSIVILLAISSSALAATLDVCKDGCTYSFIQEAIDIANTGDTIEVQSGKYEEFVEVNKQLSLHGVNTGQGLPVVLLDTYKSTIKIIEDSVTLDGFIVKSSNLGTGIEITSNNSRISGNVISGNNVGIYVFGSRNNEITGNSIVDNRIHGIYIKNSINNIVRDNFIERNYFNGIRSVNTNDNIFFRNNISDDGVYDSGNNKWDNGEIGNHFNEYDETSEGCIDDNGDNICDSFYDINGGSNVDRYPSVSWSSLEIIPFLPQQGTSIESIKGTVTFDADNGNVKNLIALNGNSIPGIPPDDVDFYYGLFGYNINEMVIGDSVNLTLTFPYDLPVGTTYWKYGPTSDNSNDHWYTLPSTIIENQMFVTLVDGGSGDDDLRNDGNIIVNYGGPSISVMTTQANYPPVIETVFTLDDTGDILHTVPETQIIPNPGSGNEEVLTQFKNYAVVSDLNGKDDIVAVNGYIIDTGGVQGYEEVPNEIFGNSLQIETLQRALDQNLITIEDFNNLKFKLDPQRKARMFELMSALTSYDPSGKYSVQFKAVDRNGEVTSGLNIFQYMELMALELDFKDINYGTISINIEKWINGDEIFNIGDGKPTVKNQGNKEIQIAVSAEDMKGDNLGELIPAKYLSVELLGEKVTDLTTPVILSSKLDPSVPTPIRFGIKAPLESVADTYNGTVNVVMVQ